MWELVTPSPDFEMAGSENIEVQFSDGRAECLSITSNLENCAHKESTSMVDVEATLEEVAGVRRHSTGGVSEDGRNGGGYVVGKAWGGPGD